MRRHICFHGIGRCTVEREPGEARYWMGTDEFLRSADALAAAGDVEISFDDGNRSDLEIALPALRERGLVATFFVLAGRLDDPASLGASDIRALRDAGMTIGSHGWDHMPWRGLSPADAHRELVAARDELSTIVRAPVTDAALPLGRYDRQLLGRLRRAGYRAVYTSDRYPARDGSWLRARYSVTSADTGETVAALLRRPPGPADARQRVVSAIKRLR